MTANNNKKKRVNFKLQAPDAKQVYIAGTFNNWDPQARALKSDKKGTWKTWMSLAPGTYEYRYVVNGQWQEDPNCSDRRRNEFGGFNSVLEL